VTVPICFGKRGSVSPVYFPPICQKRLTVGVITQRLSAFFLPEKFDIRQTGYGNFHPVAYITILLRFKGFRMINADMHGGKILMRNWLLLLAWLLPAALCADGTGYKQNEDAFPIKIVLFPIKKAVISAKIDANVEQYKVKEGEAFRQGDVIATLEPSYYQQLFNRAEAQWKEKDSALKFAVTNAARNEDLFAKGVLGSKELEQGRLERETAEAQMQFAKANMEMAKLNLNDCKIIAPYDGRLSKRQVQEFEYVRTSQPIMEIIDDHQLLAVMYLPSSRKKDIKLGTDMEFRIDETGTTHSGRVYEIAGQIDARSRTFEVKTLIDNHNRTLTAGMSGVLIEK